MRIAFAGLCGFLSLVSCLGARDISVKDDATRYYAHASLNGGMTLGADFLGRYLPAANLTIYSDEFIFVELAFFGPSRGSVDFSPGQFTLKINGTPLRPQPPGMVTVANGFAEMIARPQIGIGSGPNGGEIEIGGPDRKARFPGDEPARTPQAPPVPQVSTDVSGGQVEHKQITPDEAVKAAELPAGPHSLPVAGYLFFAWEGKLKKIKHAELEYKGPAGTATLTLR